MLCPPKVRGETGEAKVRTKSMSTRVGTEWPGKTGKPQVKRLLFGAWE